MRVVEIIADNRKGGISSRAIATAEPLRKAGIETVFVLPHEKGDVADTLTKLGFETHRITLRRPHPRRIAQTLLWGATFPVSVISLIRVIRSSRSEVVHVNGFLGFQAVMAACLTGVPAVWHLAGTASYPRWLVTLLRPFVRELAYVVSISDRVRTYFLGNRPINDQEAVIREPLDADCFVQQAASNRISIREECGIPLSDVVITCVGNLSPVKGHEYLVRAAANLCKERDDVHFILAGDLLETQRAYVDEIRKAIEGYGIQKRFTLLGRRDDISGILAETDVFALSSLSEGTPISVLEAMAHGLPVVATRVGGLPEQVEENITGLLVAPTDVNQLQHALRELIECPELRRKLGRCGWLKVREEYSMASYIDAFIAVLENLVEKRVLRPGRST